MCAGLGAGPGSGRLKNEDRCLQCSALVFVLSPFLGAGPLVGTAVIVLLATQSLSFTMLSLFAVYPLCRMRALYQFCN